MANLIQVSKHTRAGNDGKLIYCPHCNFPQRVYHFAWAGILCNNDDCDFSNAKAYDENGNIKKDLKFIDKYIWLVEVK